MTKWWTKALTISFAAMLMTACGTNNEETPPADQQQGEMQQDEDQMQQDEQQMNEDEQQMNEDTNMDEGTTTDETKTDMNK